jgi:hypothetical protein
VFDYSPLQFSWQQAADGGLDAQAAAVRAASATYARVRCLMGVRADVTVVYVHAIVCVVRSFTTLICWLKHSSTVASVRSHRRCTL